MTPNRLLRVFARALFVVGAFVSLTSAGSAQPFPGPKGVPTPVVVALLPYIGDENVQKELRLEADQAKKLVTYRQKVWDETWNTAPKDVDLEARYKATEAEFKAVLNADQLKRANQLAAQVAWNSGGFGGFGAGPLPRPAPDTRRAPVYPLTQYPAMADALKLDETQKKIVAPQGPGGFGGRFNNFIYLTPDQTDRAKELLGVEYKGTLEPQFDTRNVGRFGGGGFPGGGFGPGPGGFGGPGPSRALQFTAAPDVQKELKLNEDQLKALADLRLKWGRPGTFEDYQNTSPAARKKANDEMLAEVEAALKKVLKADQLERLKQIERQTTLGPEPPFAIGGELAKELGVNEEQIKKYEQTLAAYADVLEKAALAGKPFEKVKEAFTAAEKERAKAIDAILTADQHAKRKELLGEPFRGSAFAGGGFPGGGGIGAAQRKFTFGRYTNQLNTLARFKGVQEELKLKDDQIKKLTDLNNEMRTKFPPNEMFQALQDEKAAEKFFGDRSAFVEKALADVLTKEQQARFRELNLQRLEAPPQAPGSEFGPFGPMNTAASYPGVAEAIKLTAEQKKELLDGKKPADVLTEEQKKAITGMLGKPVKVAEVFSPPGFPGPGPIPGTPTRELSATHQAVLNTILWDELKLTRDQVAKLAPAANEYLLGTGGRRGGGGGFGPGGVQPFDPKAYDVAVAAFGKVVDDLLNAEQKKRLEQLAVQQNLANGLDFALTNPRSDTAKTLALTEDQKKKVAALAMESNAVVNLLDETIIPWDKELGIRRKLRDQLDVQILKELTADQKAKLKELTGEPFPGIVKQPLFGGPGGISGPGGFGGFGGPFGP